VNTSTPSMQRAFSETRLSGQPLRMIAVPQVGQK
jgi:hypothetical protein